MSKTYLDFGRVKTHHKNWLIYPPPVLLTSCMQEENLESKGNTQPERKRKKVNAHPRSHHTYLLSVSAGLGRANLEANVCGPAPNYCARA
jgi:hypothetical protein